MTVQFLPTAIGLRDATLSFTEDDPTQTNPFNFAIAGTGLSPSISLYGATVPSSGAIIADGASTTGTGNETAFGTVAYGNSLSETFLITNAGPGQLILGTLSIGGVNSADFKVTSQPANSVAVNSSTTFTITFQPKAAGNRSATVSLTENDPTQPSPFTFAVGGSATAGLVAVSGLSHPIADGTTTTSATNGTAFGTLQLSATPVTETYTITNNGSAPLALGNATLAGTNPSDFSIINQPAAAVAVGASTTLVVQFSPVGTGTRLAKISFTENDPSQANPYNFAVSGMANGPVIAVSGNSQPIADGATTTSTGNLTNMGGVAVGSNVEQNFTIYNSGNQVLTLGNVSFSGANSSDFSLAFALPASVNPYSSAFLTIVFQPTAGGVRNATVSFADNDATQPSPFTFALSGTGLVPTIAVSGASQPISDGSSTPSITNATDFGPVALGSNEAITYTIKNSGAAALILNTPTITGSSAFRFTTYPSMYIAPNSSTTMTVRYTPTALGLSNATISFTENDPSQLSPFTFAITGQGVGPTVSVSQNGQLISNGSTSPSLANGTDFGSQLLKKAALETITISNQGQATLALGTLNISGTGFYATSLPAASVPAGGSTSFVLEFLPSVSGEQSATVSFTDNDTSQPSPFQFKVQGFGADPIAQVSGKGNSVGFEGNPTLSNGTLFAPLPPGAVAQQTFTITNGGNSNLLLNGVSINSATGDFTIVTPPLVNSLSPGASTSFTVKFQPSSTISQSAAVQISDNDPNNNPFVLWLSGQGVLPALAVYGGGGTFSSDLIYNSSSQALSENGTYFGTGFVKGQPLSQTYTVYNAANNGSVLDVGNVTISGANAEDFTVTQQPAATVASNSFTTFTVQFLPQGTGSRSAIVSFAANDPRLTQPFSFTVGGNANQASTSVVLTSSASSVVPGQSLSLTANVISTSAGVANPSEGTVTFLDGSTVLGTAPVSAGQATLNSVAFSALGNHTLTATYTDGANLYAAGSTLAGPNSIINTVAGSFAYVGDGGSATSAQLNTAAIQSAIDLQGNVYIADSAHNVIRRIDHQTGIISTIAGTGVPGYSGNGGPATSAQLNGPLALALDSSDDLYVSDTNNSVVRKIDLNTGIISTVAGTGISGNSGGSGQATSVYLNHPQGLAFDQQGDLLIADSQNSVIRSVNLSTGTIHTIAGNGTFDFSGDGGRAVNAALWGPTAITVNSTGDLFISDTGNGRIRVVDHGTGDISTVAGGGSNSNLADGVPATSAYLADPEGVAIDSNGNLLICDCTQNRVRSVNLTTGIIATVVGDGTNADTGDGGLASAAGLNFPTGITVDGGGDWYIVASNEVRLVTQATGLISTVAGDGIANDFGDGGPATSAGFLYPNSVVVDSTGDLFVTDQGNNIVRKINASTGVITTVAGNGVAGTSGDGGPATSAELGDLEQIAIDPLGNLYIATFSSVREVNAATGIISTVFGMPNSIIGSVAVDGKGDLYIGETVSATGGADIQELNLSTEALNVIAGNGQVGDTGDGGLAVNAAISTPSSLAVDSQGNVYFSDYLDRVVRKVDGTTGIISSVTGGGTSGSGLPPGQIALDGAGDLLIAGYPESGVSVVNTSTDVVTLLAGSQLGYAGDGGLAGVAGLNRPAGVAVDSLGDVFIADTGNNLVREVRGGGIQVSVVPFQVTSFTPNASGFVIGLNAAPNFSVLNLYGGSSNSLGAADMTVLNGSTPVQGSLVWDATTSTATFIATRGLLAAGTYNVTLTSGASALGRHARQLARRRHRHQLHQQLHRHRTGHADFVRAQLRSRTGPKRGRGHCLGQL